MNNFESNLRKDNVLNTGLLAVAIVWVAMAAVRAPLAPESDTAAGLAHRATVVETPAIARARGVAAPTASTPAVRHEVS